MKIWLEVTETVNYTAEFEVPDDWDFDYAEDEQAVTDYGNRGEELWCQEDNSDRIVFQYVDERSVGYRVIEAGPAV
ncbi:hypothetical protein Mycsm_07124 (plasmid) [Mycobacterium sp. JS623]|uniref:hypothetical protein n=1 Tax=Mycobacterium sp. JS623 TaxID=212767 RepID=UPI0002A59544|nr:hypothetical protein [Mycobacterium sp. JS623]AGB27221.1 hypothetical protein Mycsm_07124 [Mycobacterium sp. JS623]